ncbi:hypothetical protein Hypma_005363 [Hypsizygus marmoreus]|uniref:Aminoglycoside phosphotransferase domain-containing protein n=1 Tax=Hypsizygus marmoreus TaxID=39966 RepID=A0A369K1X0_HYPMA|nr:hypothetical protein Hypma_005363 [Hypsizygus marmoreus]
MTKKDASPAVYLSGLIRFHLQSVTTHKERLGPPPVIKAAAARGRFRVLSGMSLSEQIAQLRKKEWVDLHGLISCANIHLSTAGPCMSISFDRGSFNHVYKLVFTDDTHIAASVSNHDGEDFNPEAKRSEIETMRFVRESGLYPDIPVPREYAFDTTFDNPAGALYILMDVLQG